MVRRPKAGRLSLKAAVLSFIKFNQHRVIAPCVLGPVLGIEAWRLHKAWFQSLVTQFDVAQEIVNVREWETE